MKSKRIRGFPVINLHDGSMEGRVQDIVIDPEKKTVEGFVIGEKGFLRGKHRFIPFESIHSIGSDAVTLKESDLESPEMAPNMELLSDYSIIGKSLISNEGNYIAKVMDFVFSPQTGKIESLLLQDIKDREPINMDVYLTIDGILNLGKDYVIADSNYTAYLTEESREEDEDELVPVEENQVFPDGAMPPGVYVEVQDREEQGREETFERSGSGQKQQEPGQEEEKAEKKEPRQTKQEPSQEPSQEPPFDGFENLKETWSHVEEEVSRGSKQLAKESKDRMRQYVRNKKANYSVWDQQGNVLVQKGQVISDEIVEKAEAQDRIPQLFFAVVSEEIEESLNIIGDKISRIFR